MNMQTLLLHCFPGRNIDHFLLKVANKTFYLFVFHKIILFQSYALFLGHDELSIHKYLKNVLKLAKFTRYFLHKMFPSQKKSYLNLT